MNLKRRIENLEMKGLAGASMVAMKLANGAIKWNGMVFSDQSTFDQALRDCGGSGKLI